MKKNRSGYDTSSVQLSAGKLFIIIVINIIIIIICQYILNLLMFFVLWRLHALYSGCYCENFVTEPSHIMVVSDI